MRALALGFKLVYGLLAEVVEVMWSTKKLFLVKPEFTVAQWAIFVLKLKHISSFFLSVYQCQSHRHFAKAMVIPCTLCPANMFS
jgi:hypothetical protein